MRSASGPMQSIQRQDRRKTQQSESAVLQLCVVPLPASQESASHMMRPDRALRTELFCSYNFLCSRSAAPLREQLFLSDVLAFYFHDGYAMKCVPTGLQDKQRSVFGSSPRLAICEV